MRNMSEVIIRCATIEDIGDICNLEKQYPVDMYSIDTIRATFDNDYYENLVITIDGMVVGYISITIIYEECNLVKIIIDEKHRKRGYATLLIKKIMSDALCNNASKVYLEVRSDNIPAKNLYEKIGFKKTNTREKYYADGMNADIYWYFLNDRAD